MAIYSSSFTGQEIDEILGQVKGKVNVSDIVDDKDVGDSTTPASSRLMKEAYTKMDSQDKILADKVMRIDGSEQTVNGKKIFKAVIDANGGMKIPAGQVLEIVDEADKNTSGVNLGMLKKHGVSADSQGAAINITQLQEGYLRLDLNFNSLSPLPEGASPGVHVVMAGDTPYKMNDQLFRDAIYSDTRFVTLITSNSGKVDTTTYNAKMATLDSAIAARVLITTYNSDLAAINSGLNARVLTSDYNTKMTSLDSAIAARVLTSTYTTKMTALDAADNARVLTTTYTAGMATKVDVTTYNSAIAGINTSLNGKVDVSAYNTKMAALDASLLTKMDYAKSGTGSAAGGATTNLITFAKKEVAMFVVTAVWAGVAKPAVFEVYMTNDNTSAFVDSRAIFAGSLTFTASLTGGNMVLQAVNGDATKTVTLSYKTLVQY